VATADPAFAVVQASPVAVDEPPRRVGDDVADGGDAVAVRHDAEDRASSRKTAFDQVEGVVDERAPVMSAEAAPRSGVSASSTLSD
jgi:hypothetical protein